MRLSRDVALRNARWTDTNIDGCLSGDEHLITLTNEEGYLSVMKRKMCEWSYYWRWVSSWMLLGAQIGHTKILHILRTYEKAGVGMQDTLG